MSDRVSLTNVHWLREIAQPFPTPEQPLPARAGVVIIGGGYTGAATALWLARMGIEAVVIERRGVATGATGRNAGFIAPGLSEPFATSVQRFGHDGALRRVNFTRFGRDLALSLIEDLGLECELERSGGLTLASSPEEWRLLRESGEALRRAGLPVEVLAHAELRPHFALPVPERFAGGLFNPETLLVNPARLAIGLMREACRLGSRLHQNTEVFALTDRPGGITVETSRGEISAGRVVLATNAWSPLIVGLLKDRIAPVRGQALVTAPVPPAFSGALSANHGYEYWSQRRDGRIILGGARWAVPDGDQGHYAEEINPAVQSALYHFLTESFPALRGIAVERQWSGIMGFSRDGYPYIGPLPGRERLIVAAGYTGHGGPYFAVAGRCVAQFIAHGSCDPPLSDYAAER